MIQLFIEIKRIFSKLPVLVMLGAIVPVFVISALAVGVKSPATALPDSFYENKVTELNQRLDDLKDIFTSENEFSLHEPYDEFESALTDFWNNKNEICYNDAKAAFESFKKDTKEIFSAPSKILITKRDYQTLDDFLTKFSAIFDRAIDTTSTDQLKDQSANLQIAWDKFIDPSREHDEYEIFKIVKNANSITFIDEQTDELATFCAEQIDPKLADLDDAVRHADFLETSCEYLELRIKIMQADNTKNITQYCGYDDFNRDAARDRLAVLGFLVETGAASFDYSAPFAFGKASHIDTGSTALDFVFGNMELITIPLIIFAMLVVVYCIFDDIKNKTVFAALVSPQTRRRVIAAKLLACAIAIAAVVGIFGLLFYMTGAALTGAASAPAVLYAFGGRAHLMSPMLLMLVYLSSLFFKVLFFAAITASLCINCETLREVLIKSAVAVGLVILLNLLLTVVFPVAFYQYLPMIALDFAGFFGVSFVLTGHLASTFIWFTLPFIIVIWFAIIASIVYKFDRKDF